MAKFLDKTSKQSIDPKDYPRRFIFAGSSEFHCASGTSFNDGQPVRRYLKDMISCGVYQHPFHEWTLSVTTERMDRWIAAFNRMRAAGVDVEVPIDHSMSAEDNRGYVVEMFRGGGDITEIYPEATDPNRLYGIHELIGESAFELAARCKNVSVLIEKDFADGAGNSYGEAITHSSIVQQPVVPGQGGFVAIAASKNQQSGKGGVNPEAPLFVLSTNTEFSKKNSQEQRSMNPEMLKKLREMLGAGDDLTEENALSRIGEHITGLNDKNKELSTQNTTLSGEIETLKAKSEGKDKAASKVEIDPDTLDMAADATSDKIDALVACGKLTPKAAELAKETLVGPEGNRSKLMLSRKVSQTDQALAKKFLSIIEVNNPLELAEKTGSQALSRQVPGEQSDFDKDLNAEMIAEANGE